MPLYILYVLQVQMCGIVFCRYIYKSVCQLVYQGAHHYNAYCSSFALHVVPHD